MIYLDNSATTQISGEVLDEMMRIYKDIYGNPSSAHKLGQKAKELIELSRFKIAELLDANPEQIIFTSGGSESDNWALKGVAFKKRRGHIISSSFEHPAVLNSLKFLESQGFEVSLVNPNEYGIIEIKDIEKEIREDTFLISLMSVNNELGTIQNLEDLSILSRNNNILLHSDGVQAEPWVKSDFKKSNLDFYSISGHKLHGPKGIGLLLVKDRESILPLINGGPQELELRAGTENVALICALSVALEQKNKNLQEVIKKVYNLHKYLEKSLKEKLTGIKINCEDAQRIPSISNISIKGVDKQQVLTLLSMEDICISAGSACASGSLSPSKALKVIGLSDEEANSSIRVSISQFNTQKELDIFIEKLSSIVKKLRNEEVV